jgi:hypothetical protein
MRSFFEREAISPSVDMGRRYRIVVRYDGIDNISTIPRPFWTASKYISQQSSETRKKKESDETSKTALLHFQFRCKKPSLNVWIIPKC